MYVCYHLRVFQIGLLIIALVTLCPNAYAVLRCPYKCKCSASSILCADTELVEVPEFKRITIEPTTIDLSKNEIEEITDLNFNYKSLEKLISLKLNDNSIFDIQSKALLTLPKLKHLDLSNNLIEDFSENLILNNKELKELILTGNLFGTKTPELKSESLEVLDLSFCKLTKFSKENVEGLPNLRLLYLQANNLIEMEYTIFGAHLQFIDISFNSWKCSCDTIKLFDHFVKKRLTVVSSPVQCVQSFRRYEDVYDMNGPVKIGKWCENKTAASVNSSIQLTPKPFLKDTGNTDESCFDFKIWICVAAAVFVIIVICACLIFIIRHQRRVKNNMRSKHTIYRKVSTNNKIVLQVCDSDNFTTQGMK